ncbi:MAG: phage integrase central domain-containing protein, partial [Actinomycetota bacterium]
MPSIEYRPDRPKPYRARYWGPDGRLHSRSFARKDDAERWLTSEEASKLRGAWVDPRGSRRRFDDWATQWWELWASEPRRSPAALEAAESHLRLHIRPYFGRRPLGTISAQVVQRWQNELEGRASHNLTMACRSILNRILEAAEGERLIPVNPVRKVRAPKRPVDPEVVFGRVRRRAYTPEEFGRLLVVCPAFYRDHFIVQVGTGLRSGELLGLRARRVDLDARRIEVVDVRYDAGRFGSGYKDRPKSDASVR